MKKFLKVFTITAIILVIMITNIYAFNTGVFDPGDPTDPTIVDIGSKIVFVFQVVGTFFAVGILAYVGIQYMIASPSEKADIKGRMVPYIVGAIMVFSMTTILQIAKNIMEKAK